MGNPATIPPRELDQPQSSPISARLLARLKAFSEARYPRSRYEALIKVIQWLQRMDVRRGHHAELEGLVAYFETNEPSRLEFQTAFAAVLQDLQSLTLLAETGIPSDQGLIAEVVQRLVSKVIPMARRSTDSSRLLINLYSTKQQVRQFKEIPRDLFLRLVAVVTPENSETAWEHERRDLCEALRLLATRVGWLGLKPEMRERSVACGISDSPFYELVQATEQLLRPNGAGGHVCMAGSGGEMSAGVGSSSPSHGSGWSERRACFRLKEDRSMLRQNGIARGGVVRLESRR